MGIKMKKIYLVYNKDGKEYLCMWFDDIQSAGTYAIACKIKDYRIDTFIKEVK